MDAINEIAKKYNLPVIEDAAKLWATYKAKNRNLSTIGSTSFSLRNHLDVMGMQELFSLMMMN